MTERKDLCSGLTDDRAILTQGIIDLLRDLPLDRLKALYIKALVTKSMSGKSGK